jgi:hypothetical protein
MDSLQAFFSESASRDIHTLARYIQQHVNEHWEQVFQENRQEMIDRYDEIGDAVYGLYGQRLFKPVHAQLKTVGLRAVPRLPGSFSTSREWGDDDSDRQRWFQSKIVTTDGAAVGTMVVIFYHDHLQIRIPRPFEIFGLDVTSRGSVIEALSRRSEAFKKALDAKDEYAAYLAATENALT